MITQCSPSIEWTLKGSNDPMWPSFSRWSTWNARINGLTTKPPIEETPSTESIPVKYRLRWSKHVTGRASSRLPQTTFSRVLVNGKRHYGASKRTYKDWLKYSLNLAEISPNAWEDEAADRPFRQRAKRFGCSTFEEGRKTNEEVKKTKTPGNPSQDQPPRCHANNSRNCSISDLASASRLVVAPDEPYDSYLEINITMWNIRPMK